MSEELFGRRSSLSRAGAAVQGPRHLPSWVKPRRKRLPGSERVAEPPAHSRDYLRRLLAFLKSHAADALEERGAPGKGLPSHRQLAQLLAIPRERLPDLFRTLRDLAEACRRKISGEETP